MTHSSKQRAALVAVLVPVVAVMLSSCRDSDMNVTNPNAATVTSATSDPNALQLLANGIIIDERATRAGISDNFVLNVGKFGREAYDFSLASFFLYRDFLLGIVSGGVQKVDPASQYAAAEWSQQYKALRDIYNFKKTINSSTVLSTAGKSAALGFAQTFEGMMLLDIAQTRDTLGGVVEIRDNAADLAPFVSRDSLYKYILNTLDAGASALASGGASFPFTLPPGFTSNGVFNTPTGFAQFNRALKARAAANYATAGGGTAAWQAVLTALQASFLNAGATTRAALDAGVYNTYGPSPDRTNDLAIPSDLTLYAHPSFTTDAQKKANGEVDDRYTAKIRTGLNPAAGAPNGNGPVSLTSTIGFKLWPTIGAAMPIIRNEELILLRAEARLATGDKAGAIADINVVRQNSGGLPASTLTTASSTDDILTGILYEKRYSLMMEGSRWIDMRRYGRLDQLPLDIPSGANKTLQARVVPIPAGECTARISKAASTNDATLLGPNGQNNCAP